MPALVWWSSSIYTTAGGRGVASVFMSRHHHDTISGAVLPREIQIQFPTTQLDLHITLDDMQVNSLGPQNAAMWVKPAYPGYPEINLAQSAPPMGPPRYVPSATVPPPSYGPAASVGPGANYGPQPTYSAPPSYRPYP